MNGMTSVGRHRSAGDAGFVSILFAVGLTAIMMIIALSFDFGGRLRSAARAQAIAETSARAGAQDLVLAGAITGQSDLIDPDLGPQDACAYALGLGIAKTDCTAQVSPDGQTITVTVWLQYTPTFLPLFLPGQIDQSKFRVTGKATAQLIAAP